MKLQELLKAITHQNYKIFVQNTLTLGLGKNLELTSIEDIKAHFNFQVLAIDENWNIILKGE